MLTTNPDSLRPDHSAASFLPAGAFEAEDDAIATKLAAVILRQASEGQPTELRHFREAEETKTLTPDQIALNLGRARAIADRRVIRQDDPSYHVPAEAGHVHGIPEAPDGLFEKTDEELIALAQGYCTAQITDDLIVGTLLEAGYRPAAISRIWDRLKIKLAADLAKLPKPSIGALARRAHAL
jgi:hypothetical protein